MDMMCASTSWAAPPPIRPRALELVDPPFLDLRGTQSRQLSLFPPAPRMVEFHARGEGSRVRRTHIGHWALGCSLTSWILLAIAVWMFVETFCFGRCPPVPLIYALLIMVSVPGFLVVSTATVVLSIRALVLHHQRRWAVAALIVMFLPAALGVLWFFVLL